MEVRCEVAHDDAGSQHANGTLSMYLLLIAMSPHTGGNRRSTRFGLAPGLTVYLRYFRQSYGTQRRVVRHIETIVEVDPNDERRPGSDADADIDGAFDNASFCGTCTCGTSCVHFVV